MSESDSVGDSVHGRPSVVHRLVTRLGQIYQFQPDNSAALQAQRWVVTPNESFHYMIQVYLLQGWDIVTDTLGVYHLNVFLAFLSPKVDLSLMEDSDRDASVTNQIERGVPALHLEAPRVLSFGMQRPRASSWPWSAPSLRRSGPSW